MFGINGAELLLILLFAFLIFGPDKLPEIARTIGKGIARFRAAQEDMNDVIRNDVYDPSNPEAPFKDPTQAIDKLANTAEKHIKGATDSVKQATHGDSAKKSAKTASAQSAQTAAPVAATTTASAAATSAVPAQASTTASQPTGANQHKESFTERKARYERERAAKLAEEQKKAEGVVASNEGGDQ